ncbi:hypothetical protein HMPREF9999_02245 [Alloprevotella sp. oral taxon 473 str. F0040]|nr:hypothetical protein HMPREF9999_02245 [Alloprevotella sp. oral taxon 473 str. F0040]
MSLISLVDKVHNRLKKRIFRKDHNCNDYGSNEHYNCTVRQLPACGPSGIMR